MSGEVLVIGVPVGARKQRGRGEEREGVANGGRRRDGVWPPRHLWTGSGGG